MIQHFISGTLGVYRGLIMGKTARVYGFAVNYGNNTVDSNFTTYFGPVERANQWLRQCQTRGFNHDMIRWVFAAQ